MVANMDKNSPKDQLTAKLENDVSGEKRLNKPNPMPVRIAPRSRPPKAAGTVWRTSQRYLFMGANA